MHLKQLQIQGFKSFADRTTFEFGPGMTVIAGPNGSGKSNVTDAIRWVLGEQTASSLRAKKSDDVIWIGSDSKRPAGFAEATLTFNNTDHWLPSDYSEVAITRRVHRDGQSEYLLNKRKVRLTDLTELMAKADFRQGSYSYLSQGLVDKVLSLKPDQRRALIEEAADLHSARQRLRLSERRLKETRDNLGHARMQVRELEPRLRSLKRQTTRAEKYQELRTILDGAFQEYFTVGFSESTSNIKLASENTHELRDAHLSTKQRFEEAQKMYLGVRTNLESTRSELVIAERDKREKREALLYLEQDMALAEQRSELFNQRRNDLKESLSHEPEAGLSEDPFEHSDESLRLLVLRNRAQLEQKKDALTEADQIAREVLRDLAEREARRARFNAEQDELQARLLDVEAYEEKQVKDHIRNTSAAETVTQSITQLDVELARHQSNYDEMQVSLVSVTDLVKENQISFEASRSTLNSQTSEMSLLESEITSLESQIELQELLVRSTGEISDAIEFISDVSKSNPTTLIDILSKAIHVPDRWKTAIEAWMGDKLTAVIFSDRASLASTLNAEVDGINKNLLLYSAESNFENEALPVPYHAGVIAPLVEVITAKDHMTNLLSVMCANTYLVTDFDTGMSLSRMGYNAVTETGEIFQGDGGVRLRSTSNPKSHLSLVTDLSNSVVLLEKKRNSLVAISSHHTQLVTELERVSNALDESKVQQAVFLENRELLATELSQLEKEHLGLKGERALLLSRVESAEPKNESTSVKQSIQDRASGIIKIDDEIQDIRDRAMSVNAQRDSIASEFEEASAQLAAADADQRAQEQIRSEREADRVRRLEIRTQSIESLNSLDNANEELGLETTLLRDKISLQRLSLVESKAVIAPMEARALTLTKDESTLQSDREELETELRENESKLLNAEHELNRLKESQQRLIREMEAEEFTEDMLNQPALIANDGKTAHEVFISAEEQVSITRSKLRSLGPVNIDALDEYQEIFERHEFLTAQISDLERAQTDVRAIIRDLRAEIRIAFVETFEQVNMHFREYFTRFFGGGRAELKLVQPERTDINSEAEENEETSETTEETEGTGVLSGDNSLVPVDGEAGVEIYAQPPDKRITRLAALSGGERSLTSVALLFALLSVNPSPIVVLDEVDAALDETNIGRFVQTVRDFTGDTQFIVVSHSRITIEAADSIYGISMGPDSMSQVLSIQLGPADAQSAA